MTWTLVILEQACRPIDHGVIRRSWLNMSKSLTYLVFFGRFSINGGQNIFLSFSFLIVNSLSPRKRQIFSFDSSQSIEHHFDFPLLIAQSILWNLYRASNWERFGLHRPTTLFVCDRPRYYYYYFLYFNKFLFCYVIHLYYIISRPRYVSHRTPSWGGRGERGGHGDTQGWRLSLAGRGRVYSLLWPLLARKGYLFLDSGQNRE